MYQEYAHDNASIIRMCARQQSSHNMREHKKLCPASSSSAWIRKSLTRKRWWKWPAAMVEKKRAASRNGFSVQITRRSVTCVRVCVLLRFDASQLIYFLMARSVESCKFICVGMCDPSVNWLWLEGHFLRAFWQLTPTTGKSGQKSASAALKHYLFVADGLVNLLLTVILMDTHTVHTLLHTTNRNTLNTRSNCRKLLRAQGKHFVRG